MLWRAAASSIALDPSSQTFLLKDGANRGGNEC
jgi:hypothetical protein